MEYLDDTGRQRLGDALKGTIGEDARLSIIASYFTVYAYGELREELSRVRELRFVFDQPTFLRRMQTEKEPREWEIQRRAREIGVAGTGLELTLSNNINQRTLVRECAEWARERAFSQYYTTTILFNTVTVSQLIEIEMRLDGYNVIDEDDVDKYAEIVRGATTKKLTARDVAKASKLVQRSKTRLESMYHRDLVKQGEFRMTYSGFVRLYEFLSLASSFGDADMEKKYGYVRDLLEILDTGGHGGISVKDKINFDKFTQKEIGDMGTKDRAHPSDSMVSLAGVSTHLTNDEQDRLSEIIATVNARVGGDLDSDIVVLNGLQVKELLLKTDAFRASALANSEEDFTIAYFDKGEDVLYEGLNQNNKFFGEVLKDDELLHEFLGLYVHDVYKKLRGEE